MSSQGTFDFLPPLDNLPKKPERLFFGVTPAYDEARKIIECRQQHVRDDWFVGQPRRADLLHVSLHHVGDYPYLRDKYIFAAERAAEKVVVAPFSVILREIGTLKPFADHLRWPLALLCEKEAFNEIWSRLGAAMMGQGLRPAPGIMPHVTLGYGQGPIAQRMIAPIKFIVHELVLIHSRRGLSQHIRVGVWPLHAKRTIH